MYRKRSKGAAGKAVVASVVKASTDSVSVSLDGPSSLKSSKNSNSRRSPSPDDLFEDSPDEIGMEEDEPRPSKHRLSLSMIVPSQSRGSQMTQSKRALDASFNSSNKGELSKTNDEAADSKENSPVKPHDSNAARDKLKTKDPAKSVTNNVESQKSLSNIARALSQAKPGFEGRDTQSKKTARIFYMLQVVTNAGMTVCDDLQQLNILSRNQNLFVRDVAKSLTHDKMRRTPQQCVDHFMEDLEKYLSDSKILKIALLPTQSGPDYSGSRLTQDSLMRLLLSVDLLQPRVLEILIDKLRQITTTNGCLDDTGLNEMAWTQLVMSQMMYHNNISSFETCMPKLIRLLHSTANTDVKREIIKFLPEIIGDDQRKEVVDELMSVMQRERDLLASALTSLQNLCPCEDELVRLRPGVIETLRRTPLEAVPALVRFLLSTATPTSSDEVINGLRSELSVMSKEGLWPTQATQPSSDSKLSSAQLLVFEKLRDSLLMSRKLANVWLKNITRLSGNNRHKPLDVIVLLILYSIEEVHKKKSIESVWRSLVKSGVLKENLISETFDILFHLIIEKLFQDVLRIAGSLLLSQDITVSQFGAFIFTECFVRVEWCIYRRVVVKELVDVARVPKGSQALSLLHSLTTSHPEEIAPFMNIIMLLLDSVSALSIPETRLLMSILCMVAFGPDYSVVDTTSLQDVIYMLVHKQLCCVDANVFMRGVVSSITAIKYMADIPADMDNPTPLLPESADENSIVLSAKSKRAFDLFERVMLGTRSHAEAQVLALDQLSYTIMDSDNMDKCFIKKVSEMIQADLLRHFIIASSDFKPKLDGLEAKLQYCLDDDIEDPIVVCLSEAVVKSSTEGEETVSCSCLGALVRVVSSLERADLTEIDGLLGCALVLPHPSIYSKFSTLEPYIQRLALDCLFHAANWFREIINTFVCFIKQDKPDKVVKRLRLLIDVQTLIVRCLPSAVNYQPPICNSSTPETTITRAKKVGGGGRGRGRPKRTQDGDETVINDEEEAADSEESHLHVNPTTFSTIRHHLRELDFDTAVLFTLPFVLSPKPPKEGEYSSEFGPRELMLMLDDFSLKLRHVLTTKRSANFGRSTSDVGFRNLSTVSVDHIVRTVSKLSSHLTRFLQQIVEYSHNLIKIHDGIWDAGGMFGPGTAEMKQCLCLILTIFNTFFSWQSIRNEAYSKFLSHALMKLGSVRKEDAKCLNAVLQYCVNYLKDISACVMDLPSAVNLVTLITTLVSYQEPDEQPVQLDIGGICDEFLRRRWYDAKGAEVKGAEVSRQVAGILDIYLSGPDALARTAEVIGWLTEEARELDTQPSLDTFPHFNKSNVGVLIGCLCRGLGTKRTLEGKEMRDQLTVWEVTMTCLQGLTVVVKAQDTKINLRQFFKESLPVLKLFLSQGMNVCSCMFKMESLLVSQILKKLQAVTRYLQSVCNFIKMSGDGVMIKQLPAMRGCLESIVLGVKNMVLQNECTDAFFVGALRNKGLKGEIIASQEEEESEEDETVGETNGEVESMDVGAESQPLDVDNNDNTDSEESHGNISDTC